MIGWIMLSRKNVASAEAALKNDQLGVRDEIGFLSLHQAFSDRFFPGTSVLHTRMRYALFVPWLIEASNGDPEKLRKHEMELTWQLNLGQDKGNGVIGGSIPNRSPIQPSSMIYWSALNRWHILHPRPDGVVSSRSEILKRIASTSKSTYGRHSADDGDPLDTEVHHVFANVPSPPLNFLKNGEAMDFSLLSSERKFMRKHLIGVLRGEEPQTSQSLLARIVDSKLPVEKIFAPWASPIREIADSKDRPALIVAKQAAALTGIGRAIYAALVEAAKAADGGQITTRHREDVKKMLAEQGKEASKLDLFALDDLVPDMSSYLRNVLSETQKWVISGQQRVEDLRDVYSAAEFDRKKQRSRLANNLGGRSRRAEWSAEDQTLAQPLHFRWGNVRRLLIDLGVQ